MKTGEAPGPSDVSLLLIYTSGGIQVIAEICHRVLDGLGMPVEWALSIVVTIFMGKGDIRNISYIASRAWNEGGGSGAMKKSS